MVWQGRWFRGGCGGEGQLEVRCYKVFVNELRPVTRSVSVPRGSPSAMASPSVLYTLRFRLRPPQVSPHPWTRGGAHDVAVPRSNW
jgi:hypothetical protein